MGLKVLIADGQRVFREGLRALFAGLPEFETIGEAETDSAAIKFVEDTPPNIAFLAIHLRGSTGVDTTRRILAASSTVRVIGLADAAEPEAVRELLTAGASGFITKCNGFSDFLTAIESVMADRIYLSPDVAHLMVANYVLRPAPADRLSILSERECQVLQLVAEGMHTKAAAAALNISTKTVDMHRQRIMGKLQIRSVAGLTKYAIREGITAI